MEWHKEAGILDGVGWMDTLAAHGKANHGGPTSFFGGRATTQKKAIKHHRLFLPTQEQLGSSEAGNWELSAATLVDGPLGRPGGSEKQPLGLSPIFWESPGDSLKTTGNCLFLGSFPHFLMRTKKCVCDSLLRCLGNQVEGKIKVRALGTALCSAIPGSFMRD